MIVKVQDLQPNMFVRHESGKGILQIADVVKLTTELFPQQYQVKFVGIDEVEQVSEDTEYYVLGQFS